MQRLSVHLLPELVNSQQVAGSVCVVIDVLRATTTIAHALVAGARQIVPCLEVDDARMESSRYEPGTVVLGGGRGGLPIAGFDLGNSPGDCQPANVGGRTLVFTTTNGTKAMRHCQQA